MQKRKKYFVYLPNTSHFMHFQSVRQKKGNIQSKTNKYRWHFRSKPHQTTSLNVMKDLCSSKLIEESVDMQENQRKSSHHTDQTITYRSFSCVVWHVNFAVLCQDQDAPPRGRDLLNAPYVDEEVQDVRDRAGNSSCPPQHSHGKHLLAATWTRALKLETYVCGNVGLQWSTYFKIARTKLKQSLTGLQKHSTMTMSLCDPRFWSSLILVAGSKLLSDFILNYWISVIFS